MLNAIKKNGAVLAVFACASTGLVAITNALTASTIQEQEQAQLMSVLNEVVPENMHDNQLFSACTILESPELGSEPVHAYIAQKQGETSAIALEAIAPDGYSGKIKIIVGVAATGEILGTRVLSHKETPGLGDKIDLRVSDWILGFNGKSVPDIEDPAWAVRKDGGQFDQFTGATITPRAVVKAVKQAVWYVNQNQQAIASRLLNCGGQ
ncbi:electron transport complex subunit RsxG [Vibrio sp. SCSIO 43132]|uniref:electron transport complex subunit RsxG n=1 Tax=Vibrio sp. SCSIO 43132 TaxID=2779363 RepID=UPI001CA8A723|nr:electron transport complex subunit RsxG [Vibrio sp. SCSIO 43132]UAB71415.1 electron transport complex subunit RsxG [Vibrio sp. SCSIO 43132]